MSAAARRAISERHSGSLAAQWTAEASVGGCVMSLPSNMLGNIVPALLQELELASKVESLGDALIHPSTTYNDLVWGVRRTLCRISVEPIKLSQGTVVGRLTRHASSAAAQADWLPWLSVHPAPAAAAVKTELELKRGKLQGLVVLGSNGQMKVIAPTERSWQLFEQLWMALQSLLALELAEPWQFDRETRVLPLLSVLAIAGREHSQNGWITAREASKDGKRGSALIATERIWNAHESQELEQRLQTTETDLANACVAWMKGLDESSSNSDRYHRQLKGLAVSGWVDGAHVPLAASAIDAYLWSQLSSITNVTDRGPVGQPKHRLTMQVQALERHNKPSQFGSQFVYTLEDLQRRRLSWTTSKADLPLNEWMSVKATVQRHVKRQGVTETDVTRLTVLELQAE